METKSAKEAQVQDLALKEADGPKRKARVLLVYLVFLLSLCAGSEGIARLMGAYSNDPNLHRILYDHARLAKGESGQFRFIPDTELPYRLKPNFEFISPDGYQKTKHNSSGFRGEAFTPKSDNTLRILCLGGSTTYGVSVVDNAATYPASLNRLLNDYSRQAGREQVEVFNLGVGGYTSREVLATLKRYALPLEPDIVLIQSGVNDVAPRFYPDFAADYTHFRKPLQSLNVNFAVRIAYHSHLFIIAGWKLGLLKPLTLQSQSQYPLPPVSEAVANLNRNGTQAYQDNLSEAIDVSRKADVHVWLLTQAHMFGTTFQAPTKEMRLLDDAYHRGMIEHNLLIRELAKNKSVGLIDLENTMPPKRAYFHDPIHMSEEGNQIKAKLIAQSLQKTGINRQ